MDGFEGNFWTGEHPSFSKHHSRPFVVVIDLQTGYTLRASHFGLLEGDEILDAVKEAADN